jgi:hypothetical protein
LREEEFHRTIAKLKDVGYRFMKSDFDLEIFKDFEETKNIILKDYEKLHFLNKADISILDNIRKLRIDDFKLNLIEKWFYFKFYQYRFKSKLASNKEEDIYKRYVIDIVDKIENINN